MIKITKGKKNIWVTFIIESEKEAVLKGSWDNWKSHKMKQRKDGKFWIKKALKEGEYQFGYECDGKWQEDDTLENINSPYGTKNSVLRI